MSGSNKAEIITLGHQAPKGYRINECHSIHIEGDLHYCGSHNFMYNAEEEKRKLYNGEACYYTDVRFFDVFTNFYRSTYLYNRRFKPISIKAAIRRTMKCRGIPVGTIVEFGKSYYHPGRKFSNSFLFKVRKENPVNIEFEVNNPCYADNFSTCERSNELVRALRDNGFLVCVTDDNGNFISRMISSAILVTKGEEAPVTQEEGEVAIAYGHGKKIGFSSNRDTLYGYSNGQDNILWDSFGNFNKWSQCEEISKDASIDDIIKILTNN